MSWFEDYKKYDSFLDEDSRDTMLKVICKEVRRPDLVIFENVDYIHRTPMTILATGAMMEIDCDAPGAGA